MADFPSIKHLNANGFSERLAGGADLSSPTDAGYEITRRRFTRQRLEFTVPYVAINQTHKATLAAFIATHGTSGEFYFIHPDTLATHTVRFVEIPEIRRSSGSWSCTVRLREV